MKYLIKNSFIIILTFVFGIGLNSCTDSSTDVVPKTLEDYRAELKTFVEFEITKVNACNPGYNKGDFKISSTNLPNFDPYKANYLIDLNAALVSVNDADATIDDFVTARKNLTVNGELFNKSLWTADRRALNDLIVELTATNSATIAGAEVGQASQTVKDDLTAAITAAKSVRDSSASIQRIIDAAVVTLTTAKSAFEAALIK